VFAHQQNRYTSGQFTHRLRENQRKNQTGEKISAAHKSIHKEEANKHDRRGEKEKGSKG
jgi:hypothetical protein